MYIIKKPFSFAHGGVAVETFQPSEDAVPLTEECAAIAVREGWASKGSERITKAAPRAPKTKRSHDRE